MLRPDWDPDAPAKSFSIDEEAAPVLIGSQTIVMLTLRRQ